MVDVTGQSMIDKVHWVYIFLHDLRENSSRNSWKKTKYT